MMGDLRYCITNVADGGAIIFAVQGTINLTGALPDLTHNITIEGPGADQLAVRRDTGGDYRIFTVNSVVVTISGLTISNGNALTGEGGGIYNAGTLTLTDSTLSGNDAYRGGGIYNSAGTLFVSRSTLSGNSAGTGFGGGIYNYGGTLTVWASALNGNGAFGESSGAGIYNTQDGSVTVIDSTLSHNLAETGGGITNNVGTLTVIGSTLSSNTGGGIYNYAGTVTVTGSTLNGNSLRYGGGGGIANAGTLTVTGTTLNGNSALHGGGIANYATLIVTNSTLSGNTTTD
ncbi:MAG TPA: hypothetical protein VGY77_03935, partial [Gemmataceae bacterium]|nr:hypothetical protein [Gemmataceae bacterium]